MGIIGKCTYFGSDDLSMSADVHVHYMGVMLWKSIKNKKFK